MYINAIVVGELPESCAECIFAKFLSDDEYVCIPSGRSMTHDEFVSSPPPCCPLKEEVKIIDFSAEDIEITQNGAVVFSAGRVIYENGEFKIIPPESEDE